MTADKRAVVSGAGYRPATTMVLSDIHDTGRRCDEMGGHQLTATPSPRAFETEELLFRATKVTA